MTKKFECFIQDVKAIATHNKIGLVTFAAIDGSFVLSTNCSELDDDSNEDQILANTIYQSIFKEMERTHGKGSPVNEIISKNEEN